MPKAASIEVSLPIDLIAQGFLNALCELSVDKRKDVLTLLGIACKVADEVGPYPYVQPLASLLTARPDPGRLA